MKGLFRTKLNAENLPANRWPELLPDVQLAMNNKTHAATKRTPAELMFGENMRRGRGRDATHHHPKRPAPDCSVSSLNEEISDQKNANIQVAKDNLREAAVRMKKGYDQHIHEQAIVVGDQVFVKKNAVKPGESKKLSPLYHKLSEVMEVNMPLLRIKNISTGSVEWRHHNQLKKRNTSPRTVTERRVRFSNRTPTTPGHERTRTDQQDTPTDDTSLEATSTTPNLIDFDDDNPTDNELDNGMGVDGDITAGTNSGMTGEANNNSVNDATHTSAEETITAGTSSGMAGEANNNSVNDATHTSAEETITAQERPATTPSSDPPAAPTIDGTSNEEPMTPEENNSQQGYSGHEQTTTTAALERRDGTARGRPRKALRTEQLLRNLRPRANRNTGTGDGADD
jgi:hypothetical protein